MTRPVLIANSSGFYGDRDAAMREMVEGGPIDVLTGDYLAELTMLILWKARRKDESLGYATTFLRQMQDVLGTCLERGVKVVANAGGLNPEGLAGQISELANRLGLTARVAYITGDDLAPAIGDLQAAGHVGDLRMETETLGQCADLLGQASRIEAARIVDDLDATIHAGAEDLL